MILLQYFREFCSDVFDRRRMIWDIAVNDFKARFSNSVFGAFWAFVQPLVSILVYWFVFEVGFRSPPVDNVPFILWFTPAYISWIYFSETVVYSSACLAEYSYLVKKVNFRTSVLPVVKMLSGLFLHLFFLLFLFLMNILYGNPVRVIWLQSIYYMFAMCILTLGLGFLTSSITLFFRDMTQIVQVVLQVGFWLTPIFYSEDNIPHVLMMVLKLNPMFYITRGYRDSFIYGIPFYERVGTSIYFWIIASVIFLSGALVFRRMRPHFADVI